MRISRRFPFWSRPRHANRAPLTVDRVHAFLFLNWFYVAILGLAAFCLIVGWSV